MAQKRTLSVADIMALEPGPKIIEVKHPSIRGLILRVHPGGKKGWSLRYALHHRDCRVSLGAWPAVTTSAAESRALELLGLVAQGIDPAAQLSDAKSRRQTLAKFAPDFLARHGEHLKPRTLRDYEDRLNREVLPKLGKLALEDIGQAQVSAWHHSLRATPFSANRGLAVLSVALGKAIQWGLRAGPNPCEAVQRYKEPRRHRYLTMDEIQRVGMALDQARAVFPPLPLAAIALQILTGMRPGEVLAIKWVDLNLRAGTLKLPEHKTDARGERAVILPPEAVLILKSLPRYPKNPHVFAGRGKNGTIGFSVAHAWAWVRETAGVQDVRLHDLRHTYASHGIARGFTLAQVGQLLGHSTPATTSRYAHLVDEQARINAGTIAGALGDAMKKPTPEPPAKGPVTARSSDTIRRRGGKG